MHATISACMCDINVAKSYSKWFYGCSVPSSNETDCWEGVSTVKLFMRYYTDWLAVWLPLFCPLASTNTAELESAEQI